MDCHGSGLYSSANGTSVALYSRASGSLVSVCTLSGRPPPPSLASPSTGEPSPDFELGRLAWLFPCLGLALLVIVVRRVGRSFGRRRAAAFVLRHTNKPPLLGGNHKFHLFMSHTWRSGQDQVAVIKRQLNLLLPHPRIFLDVDDLENIDMIEQHVQESAAILIFMSKGYFSSRACLAELSAALACDKSLVLVHEASPSHGGAELKAFRSECPEVLRDYVFFDSEEAEARNVIVWRRTKELGTFALQRIAEALVRASFEQGEAPQPTPPGSFTRSRESSSNRKSRLSATSSMARRTDEEPNAGLGKTSLTRSFRMARQYTSSLGSQFCSSAHSISCSLVLPGSITERPMPLTKNVLMLASEYNPGAREYAEELASKTAAHLERVGAVTAKRCSVTARRFPASTELGGKLGPAQLGELLDMIIQAEQAGDVVCLLLRLDRHTWSSEGKRSLVLAHHVRTAREAGLGIILVHDDLSCDFETISYSTPDDLVMLGLYRPLAITLGNNDGERDVSMLVILQKLEKELKATMRKSRRWWDGSTNRPSAVSPSPNISRTGSRSSVTLVDPVRGRMRKLSAQSVRMTRARGMSDDDRSSTLMAQTARFFERRSSADRGLASGGEPAVSLVHRRERRASFDFDAATLAKAVEWAVADAEQSPASVAATPTATTPTVAAPSCCMAAAAPANITNSPGGISAQPQARLNQVVPFADANDLR